MDDDVCRIKPMSMSIDKWPKLMCFVKFFSSQFTERNITEPSQSLPTVVISYAYVLSVVNHNFDCKKLR